MTRKDGREANQLRSVEFEPDYVDFPEGSILISMGKTRVLCNVSVEDQVPSWLDQENSTRGWITAEYALLPRSTNTRVPRETRGYSGRTQEIKRLIGRSLRAGFDLDLLGKRTLIVDCDVIQADGGTRTASITGGYVALRIAIQKLIDSGKVTSDVLLPPVAAISVGMLEGEPILDLDYSEDSRAESDFNVVINQEGRFIEVQGTAEGEAFTREELNVMLDYAESGVQELIEQQALIYS
jgi:ribonuclease PH